MRSPTAGSLPSSSGPLLTTTSPAGVIVPEGNVESLRDETLSPHRMSNGALTTFAQEGREVFRRENCAACHGGVAFSDSATNAKKTDLVTISLGANDLGVLLFNICGGDLTCAALGLTPGARDSRAASTRRMIPA